MKTVEHLESLVSVKIALFKNLWQLFKAEARLAKLSIAPLIVNLVLVVILLIAMWFSLMSLIAYGIFVGSKSPFLALVGVFILNIITLIGFGNYLHYNLRNISFERTRHYFARKEALKHAKLTRRAAAKN